MSNRLLAEGTDVTYDGLKAELQTSEVLVATWLRHSDPPSVRTDIDKGDVTEIVRKTTDGYYVETRWFASTDTSDNYFDYNS